MLYKFKSRIGPIKGSREKNSQSFRMKSKFKTIPVWQEIIKLCKSHVYKYLTIEIGHQYIPDDGDQY